MGPYLILFKQISYVDISIMSSVWLLQLCFREHEAWWEISSHQVHLSALQINANLFPSVIASIHTATSTVPIDYHIL